MTERTEVVEYREHLHYVNDLIEMLREDCTQDDTCKTLQNDIYAAISILRRGHDAGIRELSRLEESAAARLPVYQPSE